MLYILSLLCTALLTSSVMCMEITYAVAQPEDIEGIYELYEQARGTQDALKIYIPQLHSLKKAVDSRRIFVAKQGNMIVGFKKAFIITDECEKTEIITQLGFSESNLIETRSVTQNHTNSTFTNALCATQEIFRDAYYIYMGSDFTHPAYRKNNINIGLTNYASQQLFNEDLKDNTLIVIFGLTFSNATDDPERNYCDRMPSIIRLFTKNIMHICNLSETPVIIHHRSKIHIPVAGACTEDQTINGFGNMLIYTQNKPLGFEEHGC